MILFSELCILFVRDLILFILSTQGFMLFSDLKSCSNRSVFYSLEILSYLLRSHKIKMSSFWTSGLCKLFNTQTFSQDVSLTWSSWFSLALIIFKVTDTETDSCSCFSNLACRQIVIKTAGCFLYITTLHLFVVLTVFWTVDQNHLHSWMWLADTPVNHTNMNLSLKFYLTKQ